MGTSVKVEAGDDGSTSLTVTGAHWVWNEVAPERRDAGGGAEQSGRLKANFAWLFTHC